MSDRIEHACPGCGSYLCNWACDAAQAKYPQPAPVPTNEVPLWDLVVADMRQRDHIGRDRYKTPLQASNGRDMLRDAYEEALDLCVYLRGEIERRKNKG